MKKIIPNLKTLVMMLALSIGMGANAQDKNIPDFANMERSAVPKEYKWKIEDIYATNDLWKTDLSKVKIQSAKIEGMSKSWTGSAANMLSMLNLINDISLTGEKLYSYAMNQSNMDLGNTEFIAMKGESRELFCRVRSQPLVYRKRYFGTG